MTLSPDVALTGGIDPRRPPLGRRPGACRRWSRVVLRRSARHRHAHRGEQPPARQRNSILRMLAGLGILSGAGVALADGLHRVITSFGISQSLLGNTAIAATVEIEEVSRVAVPTRHGRGDIALGNIVGTIAHFAAFNAGVIALARPIHLDSTSHHLHLPVSAASVLTLSALTARRRGLGRRAGALLLSPSAASVSAAE